ncbi:helix-turn-helix transcriptional regulator [Corynebacterium phoceense]
MTLIITDRETGRELWRVKECAEHCGIKPSTWTTYSAQGRTPESVGHFDQRTPLWDAEEVKAWHAARPGSPVKNHK